MSYQVLARKWRPRSFQELTGQEHVSKTIENAITANRIAHAYLFSGVRGVGKTTVARILAKSLDCSDGPTPTPCMKCESCKEITDGFSVDVIEIDGASHTGVDSIRDLQENAQYAPMRGRYKIYIIDEVHMLSTSAFNALLKILEEPPPHLIFIFATTEPHKIPNTIHSRCQHFQFRRISYREIVDRLKFILREEGIEAGEDALSVVARSSDGSMRDALSLLDQAISYTGGNLTGGDVSWILGLADNMTHPMVRHILNKDSAKALLIIKDAIDGGYDVKQFCSNVVGYLRDLIMVKLGMGAEVIDLPEESIAEMGKMSENVLVEDLQRLFAIFSKVLDEMKWFPYPRFSLEMAVVRGSNMRTVVPVDEILGKLAALEKRFANQTLGTNKTLGTELNSVPDEGCEGWASGSPGKEIPKQVRDDEGGKGEFETGVSSEAEVRTVPSDSSLPSLWKNILNDVHNSKPSLASYLEQGSPLGYDNGILTIGINGSGAIFINLIERKESKDLVLKIAKNYLPDISVINYTTTAAAAKKSGSPALNEFVSTVHEKRQEEVEDAFSEPIVKEAIDILNGELIELRNRKGG
ncbi:MAG TPA: DNA polymerase III subunit gamma/tau [Nitrospirota bacterium]|nr:DNA polymerase III subunit gamma/tau [Nitrospirota bacterium]